MNSVLSVLAASLTTFAATNIDDVFLLTLFFARRVPTRRVVAGQYIGFTAIIIVSLIAARAALAIPHRWIHMLGLLPLAIGIKELIQVRRTERHESHSRNYSLVAIALTTMSNGADNVGVYIPFFVISRAKLWIILLVYGVLIGIWCLISRWLGNYPVILRMLDRWGHWAVPFLFIGLGIYIMAS